MILSRGFWHRAELTLWLQGFGCFPSSGCFPSFHTEQALHRHILQLLQSLVPHLAWVYPTFYQVPLGDEEQLSPPQSSLVFASSASSTWKRLKGT